MSMPLPSPSAETIALTHPVGPDPTVDPVIDRRATYHRDRAERVLTGKKRRREPATINRTPYRVYPRAGRFWIDYSDPVSHERVRRPLKRPGAKLGTTHAKEAEALARELWNARFEHAQMVALGAAPVQDPSVVALVPKYIAYLFQQNVSAAHKVETARVLKYLLEKTSFGRIPDVRRITGPVISALDDELSRHVYSHPTRPGGPFTLGMRRNYLLKASAFLEFCRGHLGLMQGNPFHKHKVFRGKTPQRPADHFYDWDEVAALLDRAASERVIAKTAGNREILAIAAYTGARIGEVLRVQPGDIDFERNAIMIRSARKGRWRDTAPETRRVPLWRPLRAMLLEYFAKHRPHAWPLLFPNWQWMQQPTAKRPPVQRLAPYAWFQGLCRRANVPFRDGFHVLRHTYASARLRMAIPAIMANGERGFVPTPYEVVRLELGHSPNAQHDTLRRVYAKAIAMPAVAATELDYHAAALQIVRGEVADHTAMPVLGHSSAAPIALIPPAA